MLTQAQKKQYHQDGFVLLPDIFSADTLQLVIDEVNDLVEDLALDLEARGKLRNLHRDKGFDSRLTAIEADCPGASVRLHTRGILSPEIARLWSSKVLLDIVESIIGPDIVGHPVWNLRCKTPMNPLATVPWHQDCAYLSGESDQTFQVTAWIPLVDAVAENGCMQLIRGAHGGKVFRHRPEKDTGHPRSWYLLIDEDNLPEGERVTCEVPMGSVLLLNQLIPHRSTENFSQSIRWSLDFRWQDPAFPTGAGQARSAPMRTASDPEFVQSWDDLAILNRRSQKKPDTRETGEGRESFMSRWQ